MNYLLHINNLIRMKKKLFNRQTQTDSFNMTPIIDIVFLLIIFFMLVCQFIVAENFQVTVPDNVTSARQPDTEADKTTTVTVMFDHNGSCAYAVGPQIIAPKAGPQISDAIADAIDNQLKNLPPDRRVVSLRSDRTMPFKNTKYALAGIAKSSATDVKWAVNKQKLNSNR